MTGPSTSAEGGQFFSPGLPRSGYPGITVTAKIHPNGVLPLFNPLRGWRVRGLCYRGWLGAPRLIAPRCLPHGHASVEHGRSSRQGCGSYGVRVPSPSVSRFGRLAYSMHVSGNSTCSARTKTPRLPCRLRTAAVGAIGVASKLGGLNISEWLQLRKYARSGNRWSGLLRESRPDCHAGKADVIEGRNGNVHLDDPPRQGPRHPRKDLQR